MYDILELSSKKVAQLREIAKEMQIKHPESFKKQDLIYRILDEQAVNPVKVKKAESNDAKAVRPNKVKRPRAVKAEEAKASDSPTKEASEDKPAEKRR